MECHKPRREMFTGPFVHDCVLWKRTSPESQCFGDNLLDHETSCAQGSASHPRPCALRVGCLDRRVLSKVGTVGPKWQDKNIFRFGFSSWIFRFSFPCLESFAEF